jgi:hypothetical protein
MGAAHDRDVQETGHVEVVEVATAPDDETTVLLAFD